MKTNNPLVTIIVLTYNEEEYVSKCLDGILMQQVNFPYEVKIYDDASTDNTQTVIQQYVDRYPGVFEAHLYKINYYSQGMQFYGEKQGYRTANGKYVALCEGDDYWTDPLKLQKQVDFLESHPDYSVCFHCYRNYKVAIGEYFEPEATKLIKQRGVSVGTDIDMQTFFAKWVTMPMAIVFRRDKLNLDVIERYRYFRDNHLVYHLMTEGKCYLFAFEGAIRNMRKEGMASLIPTAKAIQDALSVASELYEFNQNQYTKNSLISVYKWAIDYTKPFSCSRWKFSARLFALQPSVIGFCKNIVRKGYV